MEDTDDITRLLHDVQAGNRGATDALYTRLYPALMRLAKTHVSRIGTVSIDGPMLLHEAYVRLVRQDAFPNVSRSAFFAYASKVMRSVIVDVRAHDVVEMRYFGGLSETEIAETLAISTQTVQRDWRKARAFLLDFMK